MARLRRCKRSKRPHDAAGADAAADRVFQSDFHRLARLLDRRWQAEPNWFAPELGAILEHQLAAPIEAAARPGKNRRPLEPSAPEAQVRLLTFGEALHDPAPSLELLRRIKDFAELPLRRQRGDFPPEIAKVLFYGSILSARWRAGQRIADLADAELLAGVDWVLHQTWVDRETQELFRAGRQSLTPTAPDDAQT